MPVPNEPKPNTIDMRYKPCWLVSSATFSKYTYQLCLNEFAVHQELFERRKQVSDGCTWETLVRLLLSYCAPERLEDLHFDSDARLFCVHSDDLMALESVAICVHELLQDALLVSHLFNRPHYALLEYQVRTLGREQTDESGLGEF